MSEPDFDAAYRGESEWFPASGVPPWDIGEPQRVIVELTEAGNVSGDVLDAGCGTGEHALYLAAHGYTVVGVDAAPTAIARARDKARDRGLSVTFDVADATELPGYVDRFDTILDSGLFHTFDDERRSRYVDALHRACRKGARVHVMCFSGDMPEDYGPRPITAEEIRAVFSGDGWELEKLRSAYFQGFVPDERAGELIGAKAGERVEMPAWLATARRL